jgi:hypothetical protein
MHPEATHELETLGVPDAVVRTQFEEAVWALAHPGASGRATAATAAVLGDCGFRVLDRTSRSMVFERAIDFRQRHNGAVTGRFHFYADCQRGEVVLLGVSRARGSDEPMTGDEAAVGHRASEVRRAAE